MNRREIEVMRFVLLSVMALAMLGGCLDRNPDTLCIRSWGNQGAYPFGVQETAARRCLAHIPDLTGNVDLQNRARLDRDTFVFSKDVRNGKDWWLCRPADRYFVDGERCVKFANGPDKNHLSLIANDP
ncbi:hypothetical protein [Kozakia baliensis]|uniref:Uncharacterized protein n=1 Tax=Kozakia baliensis TaxID=153496 RepID=A0A1D8UVK0_9PROT|nr:hypothetical protein [Kozakia baliensis]AOX17679.1 hypothetical protein A0U89_11580 [Kozakia baliensis]GBR31471.1 hypothetical protein AA0488_2289 [Kozakia baliensis NRIC 0488]GEL62819.1 hypothetical protein KBA01_01050 [Kozakia baliensis]